LGRAPIQRQWRQIFISALVWLSPPEFRFSSAADHEILQGAQ
jgi:hypothetical protein